MLQLLKLMPVKIKYMTATSGAITAVFISALFISGLCITQQAHADGSKRIVKWKDENGVTHYGDSIPPQYSNRDSALMNRQGITVQQNKANAPQQNKEEELAKLEQQKKDRALLGTFTNTEEIDLTRDRNLEPEQLALKNLQQDRAIAQKKVDEASAAAATYSKSKKPVPASVSTTLKTSNDNLAKIDQRISERQQSIDGIKKRFDEDKKRYLELKGQLPATPANTSNSNIPNK